MKETLKEEVRDLFKSFELTNNFFEKGYVLLSINKLLKVYPDDPELLKMRDITTLKLAYLGQEFKSYTRDRNQKISEFMKKNYDFFSNKIDFGSDYVESGIDESVLKSISEEEINQVIKSFLDSLDKEMYPYYQKMVNEGRVVTGDECTVAFTSLYDVNHQIIISKEIKSIQEVMFLMHEFAHSYYCHVTESRIGLLDSPIVEIKDEIAPVIIERMFIDYIREHGYYNESLVLEDKFNKDYQTNYYYKAEFKIFKYLVGKFIAQKIHNKDIDFTKYLKHIFNTDVCDLISEVTDKRNSLRY